MIEGSLCSIRTYVPPCMNQPWRREGFDVAVHGLNARLGVARCSPNLFYLLFHVLFRDYHLYITARRDKLISHILSTLFEIAP